MPNHKADANLFTTIGQVMSKIYMNIQYANVNPSKTHVYTYIHLKVPYETPYQSRSRSFLFPELSLSLVNVTCNLQVCFGLSQSDTYIASDQSHHWSATWVSRLEPALQEKAMNAILVQVYLSQNDSIH